jgi:crossover junction endodeoxyribonuclease RuvC
MERKKTILGIDPGTRITGYGLIDDASQPLDFGCIRPPPQLPLAERYKILFESLEALLFQYKPIAIAVESQFVMKNVQSAIKLGMAKGMVFLAAARHAIPVYEFAPKQAKLAVVGHGGASKHQVQKMIQALLRLPSLPEPEDAADALALAICCAHHLRSPCTSPSKANSLTKRPSKRSWKQAVSGIGSPSP